MSHKIYTVPAVEPVSLAEARSHLGISSSSFETAISTKPSISPGSHSVAAAYSLKGSGVDVSAASDILVLLSAGLIGTGGTVDVKLQDSNIDSDLSYEDVEGGAFSQVVSAGANQNYELTYSGSRKYLRAVSSVGVVSSEFAVLVIMQNPTSEIDSDLTRNIQAARQWLEEYTGRAFITQIWDLFLRGFPNCNAIRLPFPPLYSVTSLQYKDPAGVLQTLSSAEYIVDNYADPGRIALKSGHYWPSTLDEVQAVQIRFTCGYGATGALVPAKIRQAILIAVGYFNAHKGDTAPDPKTVEGIRNLLRGERRLRV